MAMTKLALADARSLLDTTEDVKARDAFVRLDIHDASRFEWSVSVPLPRDAKLGYAIEVELEIPSNAFAPHTPWDQLQSFTRLDGPRAAVGEADAVTIDGLRRDALAVASNLARASDGFSRHCLLAGSLFAVAPPNDLVDALLLWLEAARMTAVEGREELARMRERSDVGIGREAALVDEFISVRLLDVLAGAERSLEQLRASRSPHLAAMEESIAAAEERVGAALEDELALRSERGWICADAGSPDVLERYLDRASRLKKHFQEVLFLEPETIHVAERVRHGVAVLAASLASTWAICWQLFLARRTPTTEARLGSGVLFLLLVGAVVYAGKDRIKEVGKAWLTGHVGRLYAQRIARFRAPAKRIPTRDVIVAARESWEKTSTLRPDPLNPESGASVAATTIRYAHRGTVTPRSELWAQGVRRIKHVFRYDFSPLFARLDDAVKPVPVLDPQTRRVRFAAAPRCYRLPVSVRVRCGKEWHGEKATLVLTKRGLDRLERDDEASADFF
jgi:hypothetical protein